jgi:hypothetical protein
MKKELKLNKNLADGVGFIDEATESHSSFLSISAELEAIAIQNIKLYFHSGVTEYSLIKTLYHEDGEDKPISLDIAIGEKSGVLNISDMNIGNFFQLKIEDIGLVGIIKSMKINY